MARRRKPSKYKRTKKFIFKWITYLFLCGIGLMLLLYFSIYIGVFGSIPKEKDLSQVSNYTASEVFSTDNFLLGRYYIENRTNTAIEEVPEFFLNALIATEDARFYKHHGVDSRSTLRVLVKSILLFNKSSGGGSTITQQLAKNLYPRKPLGILTLPVAKVKEIIIAKRLESQHKLQSQEQLRSRLVSP